MPTDHEAFPKGNAVSSESTVHPDRLVIVVGYDGSKSASRALDAAPGLLSGRAGSIEVVFVAHVPPGAEISAQARQGIMEGFDACEIEFETDIFTRYHGIEQRWHFHRRDGLIAHELEAVADELNKNYGGDANIVILVGSAVHAYHHVVGSVPVALVRHAKYPVVVVP